ncbi:hypothetical protein P691DRAFT_811345 [Macrolepiota fuliginosa MF-IS2]|uniref:Small nuclear ribonucleoprotein Prp3 C-terminal domain-containing protein n=1 Tax=Macrolepiota fuliginosa MF-IS2 TaxID=1400762 RepID=A0A9P6C653_9AGAR|nr:hypothetical protein P691DRAFT_811345 [Macrolepiota fuliginosa MF-IS2]
MTRAEQENWRNIIREKLEEVADAGGDFPIYQLLSLRLFPLLHEDVEGRENTNASAPQEQHILPQQIHHALFTSHHLISPTKRRNLQGWSSSLKIAGFSKVGYPGVIYAQGSKDSIEEFVENVKGMQWLALKVRFVEPLEGSGVGETEEKIKGWKEFEKVGEIVEEMRRFGRGKYVLEMGIGSGSKEA